jgi:hypothetical protein
MWERRLNSPRVKGAPFAAFGAREYFTLPVLKNRGLIIRAR